LNRYNK